jgi:hypothetical protein
MTNRKTRQWLVDAGAIFTALVFFVPFWWGLSEEQHLVKNGQITPGVVQSKETVDGGGETSNSYYVRYSFQAAGREYKGSMTVEHSLYEDLLPGDPLPIQYLADNPVRNRIAGALNPAILLFVALAAVGLCFFFFLGPQRWLREVGGGRDPALD